MATAVRTAERDLPFHDGRPVRVSGRRWWCVLAGLGAGLAVLLWLPVPGPAVVGTWVRAVLFAAVPLGVWMWAVPGHWRVVFHRVRPLDAAWAVGFAVLNVAVAVVLATLLAPFVPLAANPRARALPDLPAGEVAATFLALVPHLFGEELLGVLPFLALTCWLHDRRRVPRRAALGAGVLGTALLFGAVHLPTYDWHVVQCLVLIGAARVVLLGAYLVTRNIWTATGAHVLNDWIMYALVL